MESLKLADVSGLAARCFRYLSGGFVRKLVGMSVSVARLECSSGTWIQMDGYRPGAASGRVAKKQPYNAISAFVSFPGLSE